MHPSSATVNQVISDEFGGRQSVGNASGAPPQFVPAAAFTNNKKKNKKENEKERRNKQAKQGRFGNQGRCPSAVAATASNQHTEQLVWVLLTTIRKVFRLICLSRTRITFVDFLHLQKCECMYICVHINVYACLYLSVFFVSSKWYA